MASSFSGLFLRPAPPWKSGASSAASDALRDSGFSPSGWDAKLAGTVRAATEAAGKPIGAYNLLIAGQALRHKLTLVTAKVREFGRIKGLQWEDWARS